MAADDVRVERDEFVLPEASLRALLEPGVRTGAGSAQAVLDVDAPKPDHALVQDRPALVRAQSGSHGGPQAGDREPGRASGCAHALQLLGGLDGAGALARRLRVEEVEA